MKVNVYKIAQTSPDDVSELSRLIDSGKLKPETLVAVMGKTEGNGCVNDFTRGFAVQSLKQFLRPIIQDAADEVIYVMSGGTEGVISPHLTLFTREPSPPGEATHPGLVIGVGRTQDFLPEEIGTLAMVKAVSETVKAVIAQAHLTPTDVHFVQIKCPLIAFSRLDSTQLQRLKTTDPYKSMAYSRGASALGVAIALNEINPSNLQETDICGNDSLYSTVASTSAGIELEHCEILVLGNSPQSTSPYIIGHSVMQHALDVAAVQQAIAATGQPLDRLVNLFAKAEADPSGKILGRRHTMLDDSDINHTRMARAVVGAAIASLTQDPMVYVSGGAEHQGPAGGGPVAAIARLG